MQSLWSLAAKTRSSCRCRSCLRIVTKTFAGRNSIALSKRRITVGDLFTACYSTILATAAVADSNVKSKRREQWDKVIAEAKSETTDDKSAETTTKEEGSPWLEVKDQAPWSPAGSTQAPGAWGTGAVSWGGQGKEAVSWGGKGNGWNDWIAAPSITQLGTQLAAADSNIPIRTEQAPDWGSATAKLVSVAEEESIFKSGRNMEWIDEGQDSQFRQREPKRRIHLDKIENMIAKLVVQLLLATKRSPISANLHSANYEVFLETEKIMERIEGLQHGDIRMPAYQWESADAVTEERLQLHQALKKLFTQSTDQCNLNLILAKICYNLLVSSAPPSIITYNYLIEQLSELMLHDHAQVFIDSFIHESRFRPTSKTVQLILNHYAVINDSDGYKDTVNRMRGVLGDMKIGNRHKNLLLDPRILKWAQKKDRKLILRGHQLVQKVPRDSPIFDSLIRTSLQVTTISQSVMYVRAALRENKKIKPEVLCGVVTACVAQMDYAAGESLLGSILFNWQTSKNAPFNFALSKSTRWALRELLHLCGVQTDRELPNALPIDVPRWGLGRLLFYLKLGSICDSVERSVGRIHNLHTALELPKPPQSRVISKWKVFGEPPAYDYYPEKPSDNSKPTSSLDASLSIFKKFAYTEKARGKKLKYTSAQSRRLVLQALESKIAYAFAQLFSFEETLVSCYYGLLPREWKYVYHFELRDRPWISTGDKLALLKELQTLRRNDSEQNADTIGFRNNIKKFEKEMESARKSKKARRIVQQRRTVGFVWRPGFAEDLKHEPNVPGMQSETEEPTSLLNPSFIDRALQTN